MFAARATLGIILGLLFFASTAEARRNSRTGFNFGTSVRLVHIDDRTNAGEGSTVDSHTKGSVQSLNPYVGYSFENFNLGLTLNTEIEKRNVVEKSDDGTEESIRNTEKVTKGASIFGRFLFGRVFYFEFGLGLYNQKHNTDIEIKKNIQPDGTFEGDQDSHEVKGLGPGYHLAGGLEVPMGGNFFFTSAYQVRIVQMRDHDGFSDLGAKRSFEQRREVLFGIAHYVR